MSLEARDNCLEKPNGGIRAIEGFKDIVGTSEPMRDIFRLVEKVSDTDSTVVINGESGTGKGLIARAIHCVSSRRAKPFVTINCGAIPEQLLESELFGHVRGAFTGATCSKTGKFERANGGTVFLDEIGDMTPELQVKILRVLEEKEFEPVGGNDTVNVDIRIIAATHRNLEKEVKNGNFRHDLFFRLYVIPIELPPLRKRVSDIPLLTNHFLERFNRKNGRNISCIASDAMAILMRHSWPGNVRELKNLVERLVVLKAEGEIQPWDLPEKMKTDPPFTASPQIEISDEGINLNTAVNEFEKALILQSLKKTKWVKNRAAKLLRLNRTTLVEKIKRHHIQ